MVKRTYRRRTTKKPRRTYRRSRRAPVAKLALRLLETKKNESRITETPINSLTGWYTDQVHMTLAQNDTYSGMEGHMIRGKGISIRCFIKNNATTTMLVRFGVICVKQGSSNADFGGGINVLEGNSGNANIITASSAARMTQRFNQDQLRCVEQKLIKLGATSSTDGSDVYTFKMWVPLKGQVFRYDGPGVLPTRNSYALFALNVLGNNDENLGENVELSYTTTFYYVDI